MPSNTVIILQLAKKKAHSKTVLAWKFTTFSFPNINTFKTIIYSYLPTPPLGQDMTQGQFLSGV